MKTLLFQLQGEEKLTKEQMKKIVGGDAACYMKINSDCGGGGNMFSCKGASADDCQGAVDPICAGSDCCDDVDCREIQY